MSGNEDQRKQLSHVDAAGDARMVDVGKKPVQRRTAQAAGLIRMNPETLQAVKDDRIKKGNVLAVARVAGIQAAKATPSLIPLCHHLPLDLVRIDFEISEYGIEAVCTVSCQARTGVEMEALTGASVALLTVYDMCKAIDKGMVIDQVRLVSKVKEEINE
jgi:cyclic pyranopterin phosphate synthase